jgi:hypothetical protein
LFFSLGSPPVIIKRPGKGAFAWSAFHSIALCQGTTLRALSVGPGSQALRSIAFWQGATSKARPQLVSINCLVSGHDFSRAEKGSEKQGVLTPAE